MRVLRRTGDDFEWTANKSKSEWDKDDEHHKDAMAAFVKDILELTGTRNYYLDRETLLKMYDMYMTYDTTVVPQWKQNQVELYTKMIEETT